MFLPLNVAKRPFKSNGVYYAAGTVIDDPAAIRLFRGKVAEGRIAQVDEHNLDKTLEYLYYKQGVDAEATLREALEGAKAKEAAAKAEDEAYAEKAERDAKAAEEKAKAEAAEKAKAEAAEKAKAAALEKAKQKSSDSSK